MDAIKTLCERRVDVVRTLCTRCNWKFDVLDQFRSDPTAVGSSRAPWARCGRAACTLQYRRLVNPVFGLGVCNAF